MICPFCLSERTKVTDKRDLPEMSTTRRRRECLKCERRFTTYERIELTNLTIIKKGNRRENFDRNKLVSGMLKACEKRPVEREKIEKVADEIEAELRRFGNEVESKKIGELVMKKLKKLDKVAYIRFASVYREFTDLESFEKELNKLMKKTMGTKTKK